MGLKLVLTGNHALAYAAKVARAEVIAAYPITPQSPVVEKISELIEAGIMDAKLINVESEHSALAACFGAAVAGTRVFTATSSQGLLYMYEWIHWASRARIPMVLGVVSRTINTPWNIWPDHSDFVVNRDTGWIMGYAMDNQEAFDMTLQCFKISEDPRVFLPCMVGIEGFILSHASMPVEIPDQDAVDSWLGPRRQPYVIDGSEPFALGGLSMPLETEEVFVGIQLAMKEAVNVIREVDKEYGKISGRSYGGLIQCLYCEDADYHAVSMGAWSGDLIEAVEELRREGYKIGVVRIRFMRPWPEEDLFKVLRGSKGILVYDRALSFGAYGVLFTDLVTGLALRNTDLPPIWNIVAGIGGVDITSSDFYRLTKEFVENVERGDTRIKHYWITKKGLRV
ncbi:MAG: transketolase C-terminal domain-containing protein [Desulfurococcaceae archaeon]